MLLAYYELPAVAADVLHCGDASDGYQQQQRAYGYEPPVIHAFSWLALLWLPALLVLGLLSRIGLPVRLWLRGRLGSSLTVHISRQLELPVVIAGHYLSLRKMLYLPRALRATSGQFVMTALAPFAASAITSFASFTVHGFTSTPFFTHPSIRPGQSNAAL